MSHSLLATVQRAVTDGLSKTSPMSEFPYLKLGVHLYPHAPYEDLSSGVEGSATEMINGAAVKHGLYAKICFEQLGDFSLWYGVRQLSRIRCFGSPSIAAHTFKSRKSHGD